MCRVNFMNPMPDLPFAPKLVEYPIEKDRNYKYQPDIQEKPLEMYGLEDDLGVNTDFISMGFFEQSLKHITRKESGWGDKRRCWNA